MSERRYNPLARGTGVAESATAHSPNGSPASSKATAASMAVAAPTLDVSALYGLIGEIVNAMSHATEAHPAALLGSLLGMAGAAIGRGAWMSASGCVHHPNLFECIVGASSRARKTTAYKT